MTLSWKHGVSKRRNHYDVWWYQGVTTWLILDAEGVVIIYARKVAFLLEDANSFKVRSFFFNNSMIIVGLTWESRLYWQFKLHEAVIQVEKKGKSSAKAAWVQHQWISTHATSASSWSSSGNRRACLLRFESVTVNYEFGSFSADGIPMLNAGDRVSEGWVYGQQVQRHWFQNLSEWSQNCFAFSAGLRPHSWETSTVKYGYQ